MALLCRDHKRLNERVAGVQFFGQAQQDLRLDEVNFVERKRHLLVW